MTVMTMMTTQMKNLQQKAKQKQSRKKMLMLIVRVMVGRRVGADHSETQCETTVQMTRDNQERK